MSAKHRSATLIADFAVNRQPGPASLTGGGGPEGPVSICSDPSGKVFDVVDFGAVTTREQGARRTSLT